VFGADEPAEERAVAGMPTMPWSWGYGRVGNAPFPKMFHQTLNDDGEPIQIPFCDTLFYPVERLVDEVDGAGMEIEMHVRANELRRFTLASSLIGEGGSALSGALASQEIVPLPRMGAYMADYLRSWVTELKNKAQARRSFKHFGWHDDTFLLGQTLFEPGARTKAVVRDNAAHLVASFEPRGTLATWVDIVDQAYNHPGQEAYQFMVMLSFAAPLLKLFRQYGGITVYAHSEGSGVGKTTAQRVGLSAFGKWQDLQLSDGKLSNISLTEHLGMYNCIPVMYDELTNKPNAQVSELVSGVSDGRAKSRLTNGGKMKPLPPNWATILMASGNNRLSEKLSLHRGNAEAEISRLFEFTVENTSPLSPNDAAELFPKLLDNYGVAGQKYIEHLVNHRDEVERCLFAVQRKMNEVCGIQQAERYWSALMACVITATIYCRQLGLVRFDHVALKRWMVAELNNNRGSRNQSVGGPLDLFGDMMRDIWQGILVTVGQGDLRAGREAVVLGSEPRGALTGRYIVPGTNNKGASVGKPVLVISAAAARNWCNKNGTSAREMFNGMAKAGWTLPEPRRYSLGQGCLKYSGLTTAVSCWIIDPEKAGLDAGSATAPRGVDLLEQVKSGSANDG
jgi:hypothetical protein